MVLKILTLRFICASLNLVSPCEELDVFLMGTKYYC